ncbi:MAG: hypothetical protein EOP62_09975 [Sphingomonadales bacterium]|nr:MAG: hypothetical protein EOP62_09975 [Sphingomonadales bacterium]
MSIGEIVAAGFGLLVILAVLWNFRRPGARDEDHDNWTNDSDAGHAGQHGAGGGHGSSAD